MLEGITKKYYDAVVLSEQVWEWLADNPLSHKTESPYWNKITFLNAYCPLCDIFYKDDICDGCFLNEDELCSNGKSHSNYRKWFGATTSEQSFNNANAIYQAILQERLRIM